MSKARKKPASPAGAERVEPATPGHAERATPAAAPAATSAATAPTGERRIAALHPRRFFLDVWRKLDAERETSPEAGFDRDPLIALVVSAISLTLMHYWGDVPDFQAVLAWWDGMRGNVISTPAALELSGYWYLAIGAWWCGIRILGFLVVPLAVLALRDQSIPAQNLRVRGIGEHAWMYLLAYVIVVGLVLVVSFDAHFSHYYPFYEEAHRSISDFVAWEAMYALQFFALEFFFRGYLLEQCRRSLGSHAIFVAIVPYAMIHFGKPMAETLVTPVAGIVLGTLAMRTRSVWLGFALHYAVAITMDVAAILQNHPFPTTWMPPPGSLP